MHTLSRRAIDSGIALLETLPATPPLLELKAWLRLQRTLWSQRATIRFIPDQNDPAAWLIGRNHEPARPYRTPRGTKSLWAFWMALRDGKSHASYVGPTGTIRNARERLAISLERFGHPELACELRRVTISKDGSLTYTPLPSSPLLIFE
jgi:hypothetical protein